MKALIQQIKESLLHPIGQAIQTLPAIAIALIVLFLTRHAANLTRQIVSTISHRTIKNQSLQLLLVQLSYVTAWVVGILAACTIAFPDLRLGDIIGLLGLSSVAIGFAFQDIFKNFLAGVLLLLQEPFQIGDQIIVGNYEGTVEEIAIRFTLIRTYQGERVFVPNSIVFTSPVTVLTALPSRRTDLAIGVDYNTSLPDAVETLKQAICEVEGVLSKPAPEVDIVGFGESSIDLVARYWTAPQKIQVLRTKTRAIMALKQACDRAGINIPYPIRSVYFFDQEKYSDRSPVSTVGGACAERIGDRAS